LLRTSAHFEHLEIESHWIPEASDWNVLTGEGWTKAFWLESLGLDRRVRATDGQVSSQDEPLRGFLQDLFDIHPLLETINVSFRVAKPCKLPICCYRRVKACRTTPKTGETRSGFSTSDAISQHMRSYLSVLCTNWPTPYEELPFGQGFFMRRHNTWMRALDILSERYTYPGLNGIAYQA